MQNMRKLTLKKQIKNTKPVFTILVVLAFFVSYGFFYKTTNSTNPLPLETPRLQAGESYVHHLAYGFVYDETHEQAKWIAYCLTKKEASGTIERSDNFEEDPLVSSGTATDGDYAKSGYDRGHLAPAADMRWSVKTMEESFYYSNMSPQDPGFNRGIWKRLEEQVRDWAWENEVIYVVTGPVLTSNLPNIGSNGVSVPSYYYKVILDYSQPSVKAIAFLLPNQSSSAGIQSFIVSINEVEKLTGIDFFPTLPDQQEEQLENQKCEACWTWNVYKTRTKRSASHASLSAAVQCSGMTKKGNRCKRKTTDPSGRCYQHQ
jgi:endonuclease G